MLQIGGVDLNEIHSFTDFLRNAKAYAKRLKKTGGPSVLTVNGKAELVVQDVKSYQALLSDLAELEDYRAVMRGIEDMHA
ncbi:MAG: type II toxin-antitoxin system Phd/YefM family antitoxin [Alphaproteobacteria bacterium]|nr:type II toxin-antitoxin system Phd/YefM family antitoxin [Alphaproteobacteria bacterium]